METNKNLCEKCGKELKPKIRGRELILYCEEHGDMLVTTYWDEYEKDHTRYDIILLPGNECDANNIKLIAEIANVNYINARKILNNEKEEMIFTNFHSNIDIDNAYVIRDVAKKLLDNNIKFRISPEFPHKV